MIFLAPLDAHPPQGSSLIDPFPGLVFVPGPSMTVHLPPPHPPCSMTRFLGSLRARLMLLHPSPNCSLRAESLVHVHFKEEIGTAELIPLVTTYIILFAYIYFSTRRSWQRGVLLHAKGARPAPPPLEAACAEMGNASWVLEARASSPSRVSEAWVGTGLLWLLRKRYFLGWSFQRHAMSLRLGSGHPFLWLS